MQHARSVRGRLLLIRTNRQTGAFFDKSTPVHFHECYVMCGTALVTVKEVTVNCDLLNSTLNKTCLNYLQKTC